MAKIGSVYAGTKYVTLHLVLSNGDREDLEIPVSEFIVIQNKLIAAQQGVQRTCAKSPDGNHHFEPGESLILCVYCGTSR